jgi:hypothetical protein
LGNEASAVSDPIPFKVDVGERKALADEAQTLLENNAFKAAILALRKRYFERLMTAETTDTKMALIERIRALEDVPQQLQILWNDEKMAQARKK